MLKNLKIQQFVIIDELDLNMETGLTIMTGETGAGKSILLDAMGLILGEKSDPESIRAGSDQSTFEARFAPPKGHLVWKKLIEHNLATESDDEFTVFRMMRREGTDEIKISGKPIEMEVMAEIGKILVEIHGQFANQSLTEPANQLTLLDLSGNFPPEVFTNVSEALRDVNQYTQELEDEKLFLARHRKKAREIEMLVKKFDSVGMKEGFLTEITEEHETLVTAKETMEAFQSMLGRLIATNGVVGSLAAANNTLASQENLEDEKMVDLERYLKDSLQNARDAVEEMGRLLPEYEIDLGPLERAEEILRILNGISKDYKVEFDDLYEFYVEVDGKLKRIKNGRDRILELEKLLADAKSRYLHHADILSEKRKVAAVSLGESIMAELPPLKLPKAQFKVIVEKKPNNPWTERGLDEVTFMARMNPGMPFSPISATASGGELARMMLGLKVVVQQVQTTPTLIFDEVDTGIGGAAAAAVGERIAMLADTTQVLVITHSAQVASCGHQHLYISKQTDDVTTTSSVKELSMQERVEEISRMLAGAELTDESQAAAERLITEAKKSAERRKKEREANPPKEIPKVPTPDTMTEPAAKVEEEPSKDMSEEKEEEESSEDSEEKVAKEAS